MPYPSLLARVRLSFLGTNLANSDFKKMNNYRIIKDNYLKFFENELGCNQVMLDTEKM